MLCYRASCFESQANNITPLTSSSFLDAPGNAAIHPARAFPADLSDLAASPAFLSCCLASFS